MEANLTGVYADLTGWVLYDGACPSCTRAARLVGGILGRRGFHFAALQAEWVRERLKLSEAELLKEMRVITPEGEVLGGAEAVLFLMRRIWWASPAARLIENMPGGRERARAAYEWVAARRSCAQGACALPARAGWKGWLPLTILAAAAFIGGRALPPWAFMWTLSFSIFLGFKWWMLWEAGGVPPRRLLAYWLWPGMDAEAFAGGATPAPIEHGEILRALVNTAAGAALLWGTARRVPDELAAGWCGMVGLILMLHFGSFHLLSLFWRRRGIDAEPLMNKPLLARSLGDFWSNRWNLAFRQLGHELVFRPFQGLLGPAGATAAIFLLSGLVHELVISVPARAGWGLPTLYFALQGAGVLAEKSALGKRLGLGRGLRGRIFAILVAAGPAFWLFHPPFVRNVMLPMLDVMGAR